MVQLIFLNYLSDLRLITLKAANITATIPTTTYTIPAMINLYFLLSITTTKHPIFWKVIIITPENKLSFGYRKDFSFNSRKFRLVTLGSFFQWKSVENR